MITGSVVIYQAQTLLNELVKITSCKYLYEIMQKSMPQKIMASKARSDKSITHGDFRYFKSSMSTSVVDPGTLKTI